MSEKTMTIERCHICLKPFDRRDVIEFRELPLDKPVFDAPIFGTQRIVPGPTYPCGHQFMFTQECYELSDGRFEYR